jgi:diacylglycerol kinase family enzyme
MSRLHFIVNRRSGGGQGAALADRLAGEGAVAPIADLDRALAAAGPGDRLVAVGGDGTVAAVVAAAAGRWPVGVVPVGTGNDFARAWGWPMRLGDPAARAAALRTAPVGNARRCRLVRADGAGDPRPFCLYLSLGWDAAVAGRFHRWREARPGWFRSPVGNKAIYALAGLVTGRPDLAGVRVDGRPLPGRPGCLVALACRSYAGGARPPEPAGLALHPLPAGPGFAWARSRAPGWRAWADGPVHGLRLETPLPAQADGEPFTLAAGDWRIEVVGEAPVLAGPGRAGATPAP